MGRPKDFAVKYADKVFAIDPAVAGSCGWSILNENAEVFGGDKKKPLVHRSGELKAFSSEATLSTMTELTHKLKDIWHNDSGYSSQPKILVIEKPTIYIGSPVNPDSMIKLASFVGQITGQFSPRFIFQPIPREWKSNKKKEQTKEEVLSFCDPFSLNNIRRDLESVALDKRHNVFDAIGLGIYGLRVAKGLLSKPKMCM